MDESDPGLQSQSSNQADQPGRLKVLFLTSLYPTRQEPTRCIFVRESANAVSLYNDVVVLAAEHVSSALTQRRWPPWQIADEVEDGLRTVRVQVIGILRGIGIPFYILAVLAAFRRLRHTFAPDIIHAHWTLPSGSAAAFLGKVYRLPVVLTEHSSDYPSMYLYSWWTGWLARQTLRGMARIMPVSEGLREQMQAFYQGGQYMVVPNTVNVRQFTPPEMETSHSDSDPKRILIIGSLIPRKGYPQLFEALSRLRAAGREDFVLDIVGGGLYEGEFKALAKRLGLGQQVTFHGIRPKAELPRFFQACDFFVLPSLRESCGCVVIEALACGRPVLATRCGGPEHMVSPREGLIVSPGNVDELTRGLEFMLDNYHRFDSQHISRLAHSRYSLEVVGRQLDRIYRQEQK